MGTLVVHGDHGVARARHVCGEVVVPGAVAVLCAEELLEKREMPPPLPNEKNERSGE